MKTQIVTRNGIKYEVAELRDHDVVPFTGIHYFGAIGGFLHTEPEGNVERWLADIKRVEGGLYGGSVWKAGSFATGPCLLIRLYKEEPTPPEWGERSP